MQKHKLHFFITILFLIWPQFSSANVFLLHNVVNQDKFKILDENSSYNILYISRITCGDCFKSLPLVKKYNKNKKFLVVAPQSSMRGILYGIEQAGLDVGVSSHIYNDPGRRFVKKFKINKYKSAILRFEKGRVVKVRSVDASRSLTRSQFVGVWK